MRLLRLTRVPRYLRQAGRDPSALFDQQRDVLAALRQENVMFLTVIGKAPAIPLVFGYGVQTVGSTVSEAAGGWLTGLIRCWRGSWMARISSWSIRR